MATANPYKPNGDPNNEIALEVTSFEDTLSNGGYYIKRHMRVPMKVGTETKHVAIFPKTIASQVIQTTDRAFVKESSRDILEQLGIMDAEDETQHLTINGIMQPSYYDTERIHTNVNALSILVGDENKGLIKDVNTLQTFFDGVEDGDELINKWHEIEGFLKNITEENTLNGLILDAVNGITGTAENNTGTTIFHKDTTFKKKLKIDTASTIGESAVLTFVARSGDGTQQPAHTVNLTLNPNVLGSTSQTLNILFPRKSGTLATQAEVPYIGFIAPTTPKAGDMWFSA